MKTFAAFASQRTGHAGNPAAQPAVASRFGERGPRAEGRNLNFNLVPILTRRKS
jgi:hypothetical protein